MTSIEISCRIEVPVGKLRSGTVLNTESAIRVGSIVEPTDVLTLLTTSGLVSGHSLKPIRGNQGIDDVTLRVRTRPLHRRVVDIRWLWEKELECNSTNPKELVKSHVSPQLIVLVNILEGHRIRNRVGILGTNQTDCPLPN